MLPMHHSMPCRSIRYRPQLFGLEDRLPPGDTVLGAVLGWSWLGTGLAVESRAALEREVGAEISIIHWPRQDDSEAARARQGASVREESSPCEALLARQPTVTSAAASTTS